MSDSPSAFDLTETLGYRDQEPAPAPDTLEATPLAVDWTVAISQRAHDFIVDWETGGKSYYETVIKSRPVWPEFASGITIGCGYDLGYHTAAAFAADWGGRIPAAAIERLRGAIGFRTDEPGRAAKVIKAKALVKSFSDISVPWDVALKQFDEVKLPKLLADLYRALDNLDRLHPHSRGALLSLTFNRGTGGFTSGKDRYREMREIRRLMTSGTAADFAKVPAQLRAMTRIWGDTSSLAKRRRQEADLFEAGLAEAHLAASLALNESVEGLESPEGLAETHADVEDQVDLGDESDFGLLSDLESVGPSLGDVKWNANDDDQPDYHHLPKLSGTGEFDLTAEDLESLLACNSFEPLPGLLVFALRGARIVGADKREGVTSVTIADQRPDHRDYRCVIGLLDRKTKTISAYRASTVPTATEVLGSYEKAKSGKLEGNILPTGCYTYTVGTHRPGTSHEIRGVLRLSTQPTGASQVVVLRTVTDVVYDRRDLWDACAPADNIHPGRRNSGFSSQGCLTLPGNYDLNTKAHSGLWADFRVALGMGKVSAATDDGRQFSVMLLTGLDAALAASVRGQEAAALRRLRFGSKGAAVGTLQAELGLTVEKDPSIGPVTRMALIKRQQAKLGWADGILSPDMAGDLGLTAP